jgi:hypothetical protein
VIKGYSPAEAGQRDRMQAEVDFLTYAAQVAPRYIPHLIHADPVRRCVVLEHLEGVTYLEGVPPPPSDIAAALEFFRELNADREAARQHIRLEATEGFVRLSEHIGNVRERVASMRTDHLPPETQTQARELLRRVQDATERVAGQIGALIGSGAVVDSIDPNERCVSPSDFGFHNAIRTATGVKFIDFEFAGWDDPAKAASDFVLQPRVPTRLKTSPLLTALGHNSNAASESRCAFLGPVLRLKWVCIMLAVLRPERLTQLLNTHPQTNLSLLMQERLTGAANYLQEDAPFGLH